LADRWYYNPPAVVAVKMISYCTIVVINAHVFTEKNTWAAQDDIDDDIDGEYYCFATEGDRAILPH
jgi:hypothetical protein